MCGVVRLTKDKIINRYIYSVIRYITHCLVKHNMNSPGMSRCYIVDEAECYFLVLFVNMIFLLYDASLSTQLMLKQSRVIKITG